MHPPQFLVIAGLDPAIHAKSALAFAAWMPGSSHSRLSGLLLAITDG
jgi:hypothetical protein